MNGQSTSERTSVASQWVTTVAGMCGNYGGTDRQLQLALEHPDIKKKFFGFVEKLAQESRIILPLIRRGPKWTAHTGGYPTSEALLAGIEAKGFTISDHARYRVTEIHPGKKVAEVKIYQIHPNDFGFTQWVSRKEFYKVAIQHGFFPLPLGLGLELLAQIWNTEMDQETWCNSDDLRADWQELLHGIFEPCFGGREGNVLAAPENGLNKQIRPFHRCFLRRK